MFFSKRDRNNGYIPYIPVAVPSFSEENSVVHIPHAEAVIVQPEEDSIFIQCFNEAYGPKQGLVSKMSSSPSDNYTHSRNLILALPLPEKVQDNAVINEALDAFHALVDFYLKVDKQSQATKKALEKTIKRVLVSYLDIQGFYPILMDRVNDAQTQSVDATAAINRLIINYIDTIKAETIKEREINYASYEHILDPLWFAEVIFIWCERKNQLSASMKADMLKAIKEYNIIAYTNSLLSYLTCYERAFDPRIIYQVIKRMPNFDVDQLKQCQSKLEPMGSVCQEGLSGSLVELAEFIEQKLSQFNVLLPGQGPQQATLNSRQVITEINGRTGTGDASLMTYLGMHSMSLAPRHDEPSVGVKAVPIGEVPSLI